MQTLTVVEKASSSFLCPRCNIQYISPSPVPYGLKLLVFSFQRQTWQTAEIWASTWAETRTGQTLRLLGFEMHVKSSQIPLDTIVFYDLRKQGGICPASHDNRSKMPNRPQIATKTRHQPHSICVNSPLASHMEGYVCSLNYQCENIMMLLTI